MPKQLSEAAAWSECAEWVTVRPERRKFLCHRLTPGFTLDGWYDAPPASWPITTMRSRIVAHNTKSDTLDVADDEMADAENETRALFCLFMALEAKEDAK